MTTSSTRVRDSRIARLAARQAGAFSRAQALALGFTDPSIRRRLRAGVWVRTHPGVYGLAGVPPTWHGEVWAAFLAVGPMAAVTHETSLRVHGSEHVPPRPITLTVPHGGHPRVRGAFVHQIDDLDPAHVVTADGLPVSTAARAMVEVAATLGPRHVGRVLDDLVFDKRTQYPEVAARLAEVARPGKPGVAKLAAILDERSDEAVPPGSELERAMFSARSAAACRRRSPRSSGSSTRRSATIPTGCAPPWPTSGRCVCLARRGRARVQGRAAGWPRGRLIPRR